MFTWSYAVNNGSLRYLASNLAYRNIPLAQAVIFLMVLLRSSSLGNRSSLMSLFSCGLRAFFMLLIYNGLPFLRSIVKHTLAIHTGS